jgi:hypothetical protein
MNKKYFKIIFYILTLLIVIIVSSISISNHFSYKTINCSELKEGIYYGTYANEKSETIESRVKVKIISQDEFEKNNKINVFLDSYGNYYLVDGYISVDGKEEKLVFNNLQVYKSMYPSYEDENNNFLCIDSGYSYSTIYLVYNGNNIFVEWKEKGR